MLLHNSPLTTITEALCFVDPIRCFFCSWHHVTLVYLAGFHDVLCY